MLFHRHSFTVAAVALSLSVFATGCETKVSQCNKLIKVANAATTELQSMGQNKNPDKLAQMNQVASSLDKYAKEVQGIELKDEKLQGFQKRLSTLYGNTRDHSLTLIEAGKKKDAPGMQAALKKMMSGTQEEGAIVTELNSYCQAK
ncbi:MAG: hypothetical protein VKJ24_01690 [Synechococcales bacterium]|nr:hypothetical protein [Synechococcales bacterium]